MRGTAPFVPAWSAFAFVNGATTRSRGYGKSITTMKPEEKARQRIDALLEAAGWRAQHMSQLNLGASLGVAVREFPLESGFADYLLFVDRQAVGVIEAKPEGTTLNGVAEQSAAYLTGLSETMPHVQLPLPLAYESTNGARHTEGSLSQRRPCWGASLRSGGPGGKRSN